VIPLTGIYPGEKKAFHTPKKSITMFIALSLVTVENWKATKTAINR
jgi:hypothetical protein